METPLKMEIEIDLDLICRCCLSQDVSLRKYSLDSEEVELLYRNCTSLEISTDINFPKTICGNCFDKMGAWFRFKRTIMESEKKLIAMIYNASPGLPEDVDMCCPTVEPLQAVEAILDTAAYKDNTITDSPSECKEWDRLLSICPRLRQKASLGYKCFICELKFDYYIPYRRHIRIHKTEEGYRCKDCSHITTTMLNLILHMCRRHFIETGSEYKCVICDESFSSYRLFRRHTWGHRTEKGFTCEGCGDAFKTFAELMAHKFTNSRVLGKFDNPINCNRCGASFPSAELFKQHVRGQCSVPKVQINPSKPNIVCEKCGKVFGSSSKYKSHLSSHSDVKQFKCDICGKAFSLKTNLRQHEFRHRGIRNFGCELCPARFFLRNEITTHMKRVHPVTLLKCVECGLQFKRKQALDHHMRVHTGERPYECVICSKKFSLTQTLRDHKLTHTGEKPHECMVCRMAFARKDTLKTHMKTHR